MKPLQREEAVRRRTLRPVQLVKLTQYSSRPQATEAEQGLAFNITTGEDLTGWVSATTSQSLLYDTTRFAYSFRWPVASSQLSAYTQPIVPAVQMTETGGAIDLSFRADGSVSEVQSIETVSVVVARNSPATTWRFDFETTTFPLTPNLSRLVTCDMGQPTLKTGTADASVIDSISLEFSAPTHTTGTAPLLIWDDRTVYLFPGAPPTPSPALKTRIFYFADRPLTYAGNFYEGRLRDLSSMQDAITHIPSPTVDTLTKSLDLTLLNYPVDDGNSLSGFLGAGWPVLAADVEVSQLNLDEGWTLDDIAALPADSHEVWFRGMVTNEGRIAESDMQLSAASMVQPLDQQWLGQVLPPQPDPDTPGPDPRDVGRRFDFPLGIATDMELLGIRVPGFTTTAESFGQFATTITLTNTDIFPAQGAPGLLFMVSNEVIEYGAGASRSSLQITGVTRHNPQSPPVAPYTVKPANHGIGETVIYLGLGNERFTWGGLDRGDTLGLFGVRTTLGNGVIVGAVATPPESVIGRAASFTALGLIGFLQAAVTHGLALTQQPSTEDPQPPVPPSEVLEYSAVGQGYQFSGTDQSVQHSARLRDQSPTQEDPDATATNIGRTGTNWQAGGGPFTFELDFGANTDTYFEAQLEVYWFGQGNWGGLQTVQVWEGQTNQDPANANQLGKMFGVGSKRWELFPLTITNGQIERYVSLEFDDPFSASNNWGSVYQVRRRVTKSTTPGGGGGNEILQEAAAAVATGEGIRLVATSTMHFMTQQDQLDGKFQWTGLGEPVERFPDVLAYLLQEKLNVDIRLVSNGGQLDDDTWTAQNLLSSQRIDGSLRQLGGDTAEAGIARFCWENRAQLVTTEAVDRTIYRLLSPFPVAGRGGLAGGPNNEMAYVYDLPATPRVIDDWVSIDEQSLSLRDVINAVDQPLYFNFQLPYAIDDVQGFRSLARFGDYERPYEPGTSVGGSMAEQSRYRVGRRSADGEFAFLTLAEPSPANGPVGFYASQYVRDFAQLFDVRGVPWVEGYDLEVGDVVLLDSPPSSRDPLGRIFDPFGRNFEFDPRATRWFQTIDEGAFSTVGWDLSVSSHLSLMVYNESPTLNSGPFDMTLDPFDGSEWKWSFTATPNVWSEVVFDLANPDVMGSGAADALKHTGLMRLSGLTGPSTEWLALMQARRYRSQVTKCRVIAFEKTWGLRGDLANLTLVEVP